MEPVNPRSLGAPKGYSHGMLAPAGGRLLFVAGQVGWGPGQKMVEGGFLPQFARALKNVLAVVEAAGGRVEHIGRLTVYVVAKRQYKADLKAVGEAYREVMGRHFPAMTLVEIKSLLDPGAVVEVEATAVLP